MGCDSLIETWVGMRFWADALVRIGGSRAGTLTHVADHEGCCEASSGWPARASGISLPSGSSENR